MLDKSINYLPNVIELSENLEDEFLKVFGSEEAKKAKSVVYFFLSEKPVPRINGESNILYIGRTSLSLHKRYHRYSGKLTSGRNGIFYKHILENFGKISFGYVFSDNPKIDESEYFKKYINQHLEYPPKSKVG